MNRHLEQAVPVSRAGPGGNGEPMEVRYSTPRELVEALQQRAGGARAQLQDLLREPVGRLIDQLIARYRLAQDRRRLTLHALHLAETYLRTRPPASFDGVTWASLRGTVLLQLAKLAFHPFGGQAGAAGGPEPLPESPDYRSQTFFRPHERVGGYAFGGDWFGGRRADDGSLWVLVADVTGHGYYAYLLASSLPAVWKNCWQDAPPGAQPADLLTRMHDLLEDCLPEGVYVECTLARLGPTGEATVAPAGGSRLLVRRADADRAELHKLRGTWVGLVAPSAKDQHVLLLAGGDELLLATDGVFDHLGEHHATGELDLASAPAGASTLLERVRLLLEGALAKGPQRDDITMVSLCRRNGEGDVSV